MTLVGAFGLISEDAMAANALTHDGNPAQAPRVALVIGNATYKGTDRLDSPSSDAELVANALRSIGFNVDVEENRTRADMIGDLDRFSVSASRASIAVVYYAGHGFESGGENYLIPVDIPSPVPQIAQADLQKYAVSLRYLQSTVSRGEPRALIVMLDACRSATTRGAATSSLAPVQAGHGTLIAFATQPGGAALDSFSVGSVKHQHSPFAFYLSQQLGSAGDITTILKNTQVSVAVATDDAQRPWFNNGLVGSVVLGDDSAPDKSGNVRQSSGKVIRGRGAGVGPEDQDQIPMPTSAEADSMSDPQAGDDTQMADERALAQKWQAQSLRMQALVMQMSVLPKVVDSVRADAQRGDLFAMTTYAMSLLAVPDGTPQDVALARIAQGVAYMNAASDRSYAMAEALRGGWLLAHPTAPGDLAEAQRFLRLAVDHGYSESLPRLIQLMTVTGDGNRDMYLAKYRRLYGHDFNFNAAASK